MRIPTFIQVQVKTSNIQNLSKFLIIVRTGNLYKVLWKLYCKRMSYSNIMRHLYKNRFLLSRNCFIDLLSLFCGNRAFLSVGFPTFQKICDY